MLKSESTSLFVRSLCFAAAAAVVAACSSGGTQSSLLPNAGPGGSAATELSTVQSAASVQSTSGAAYAPSSIAVKFPSAPRTGDLLLVAVWNNGRSTGAANTYTAPAGWSLVDQNTAHAYAGYQLYAHKVAAGESGSYAFKPAAAQREHVWMGVEVANASGIDKHANAFVSGSTSFRAPSLTPSTSGELAVAFEMPQTLSSVTWSNAAGWTRAVGPTSEWSGEGLSQTLSSSASVTASATLSAASSGFSAVVLLAPPASSSAAAAPTSTPGTSTSTASSTSSGGSPSVVQSANGSAYAPSSIDVKYPGQPAPGDVLAVALWNNGQSNGAANTYAAPAGWSLADQNTSHAYSTYQVYTHVVAAGESNSYVFKPLSAQREHVWIATDVTNAAGVDRHANAYVSGRSFTTPSVTPSHANDLAVSFDMPETTSSVSWSNPSGWARQAGPTSEWSGQALSQTVSSSVSQNATLSASTSGFAGILLFASGGSSVPSTPAPTAAPTSAPTSAPVSTPAPTSPPVTSSGVATYHGCPLYTPNDWFTTNLVTGGSSYVPNSVDSNSANIIRNVASVNGSINFNANVVPTEEGVNVDTGSNVAGNPSISGLNYGYANDPYNDDPSPHKMPVTSGSFMQEGTSTTCSRGDCHVIVLDTNTCVDYETYQFGAYSWNGSAYKAEGGGVENLNHPYHIQTNTVTAADLPMLGTTDFGEDLGYQKSSCQPNCAIPHVVAFVLPHSGVSVGGYVSPAAYGQACKSGCTNKLPYGARLRLHASYPCPSASTNPQANLLCNQAKQYGWILDDTVEVNNAGGIRMGVSSNGSNPWKSSDYGAFLGSVKITDFDVMSLGTIH